MIAKIHFTCRNSNGVEFDDAVQLTAETLEELKTKAQAEVTKRGGYDPWSEIIEF